MTEGKPPHRIAVRVLLALGTFLTIFAIVAVWTERQALDTGEWVNTSGKMLEDQEIRDTLANYLADELFTTVDVQGQLEKRLPEDLQPLAGPAAGGLRQFAGTAADRALESPRLQSAWKQANRRAHELLLNIAEQKGQFSGGDSATVSLELRPLVAELGQQIGVGGGVADKLPASTAELKVLDADQIDTTRQLVGLINGLAIVLSLLSLACFALAIYLSRGRRQMTVLWCGVGLIIAGLVVILFRHIGGGYVSNDLVTSDSATTAAQHAYNIGTSLLNGIAKTVIIWGFLFIIASWLASPTSSASPVRRVLAPTLRERPVVLYSLLAVAALIYLTLAPTSGLRALLTIAFLAVLAAFGLHALRGQAAAEFPDAQVGDTTARMRDFAEKVRDGVSERVSARGGSGGAASPGDQRMATLERLGELQKSGVLTKKEFDAEKARVLESS
ncbi:MAG: hypothetical protein EXQ70_07530 [Solirubrobacterales bacterium]|nr:hypothetical protein [Solirubrobacterales bacterium]